IIYFCIMRKLIDLSDEVVEALTIQAIKNKTVFKLYAQNILEDTAKPFMNKEKQLNKKNKH
ncbi:hypothetical protein KKH23_06465, partial [Patescibacteria group bacterium]|nr:hypothetical protein [Patescibacteria group bacterium]